MRIYLTFILCFFIKVSILSLENHDKSISDDLYKLYGDDITKEQIDLVLEFDSLNNKALHKKADLLNREAISLWIPLNFLEKSQIDTVESKYQYIYTLYRLRLYDRVINFSHNVDHRNIKDIKTLFFLADSYIRINRRAEALVILNDSIYKYPNEMIFHELKYLIVKDKESLKKLWFSKNVVQHFARLHNRLPKLDEKSIIELLLTYKIKKLETKKLKQIELNYPLLRILKENMMSHDFTGEYSFDTNSDTFIDTTFNVIKTSIVKKSVDTDGDKVSNVEIFSDNDKISKIRYNNKTIIYNNYPYIDTLTIKSNITRIFNFYPNSTIFEYGRIDKELVDIDFNNIVSNGKIKTIKHTNKDGRVLALFDMLDDEAVKVYLEPNRKDTFDRQLLIKDGSVVSGVYNIDSEGKYDLLEFYKRNILREVNYNIKLEDVDSENYYPIELPNLIIDSSKRLENSKILNLWWKQ